MAKPTPPQDAKDEPQEPRRLGGFELLGRLGKGGMGTVLKARQVSMDRLVALKILPKKLAENETFVQRFLREARSAAKLRHPNIVQAFDVGQADGYYFFAMEFVDGETLADLVRRDGPLEPNRALDVMKQVTSALAAAHEAGIVHRDIKPSNIMLDKKGEVRVADFGLAKRTEGDVAVTADGSVVGTPAYVAPEMAKGGEADARSDLYSLGATIFCALAGRPPFEGKNFSEVLVKQATAPAPPLASLAPRVDRRLCHVIDRLLRKNPEARFPSANALLDDLNGLGKLQSVAAAARAEGRAMIADAPTLEMTEGKRRMRDVAGPRPPASGLRPPPARLRRTTLIAVGAIVAILAIVGIVIATRKPKDTATTPPPSVPDNLKPKTEHPIPPNPPKVKELPKPPEPTPVPEPKDAAALAKWDALKADAKKLLDAGKLDDAAKLLDGAKALPLDGIVDLIAEQMESIESAKRKAAAAALAAYQAESDKLWALFKARDYPAADALLKQLAADPRFGVRPGVRPAGAEDNLRVGDADSLADHFKADLEAAKLLKEFWAAVEKGVAARKGTISIGGALGNVTGVENGVITIKTAKETVTRRVLDLTAKQALAYAAVAQRDDERSRLAEAIFRIAEGEDAALADKALAAAGNPPGLSVYKDRLAALTLGAAEVAARKAWAEIEALAKGKLTKASAKKLLALLDDFATKHGKSACFAGHRNDLAGLRARVGELHGEVAGGSRFFQGALRRLQDGRVELAYDWSDASQLKDWKPLGGASPAIDQGEVQFGERKGPQGIAHLARFVGDIDAAATFRVLDGDDPTGDCSIVICHEGQRFYAAGVRRGRQRILKRPADTSLAWSELSCPAGVAHSLRVLRSGDSIRVWIDGKPQLEARDAEYSDGYLSLGAYLVKAGYKDVRITARLDPHWLAANPGAAKHIAAAPLVGEAPKAGKWQSLFDGKTLAGWRVVEGGDDTGHGEVRAVSGELRCGVGKLFTGVAWTRQFPTENYEVEYEAKRVEGTKGFGSVLFPVGPQHVCLTLGGWDGTVVSLHWMDGKPGIENSTAKRKTFEDGRWYQVRLRVSKGKIEAWIDDEKMIDVNAEGRTFSLDGSSAARKPFGFSCGEATAAALRNIRLRRLGGE